MLNLQSKLPFGHRLAQSSSNRLARPHTHSPMTDTLDHPLATPRHPMLTALGQQLRSLRSQRGLTRKALARATGVSERHLANLEQGSGNASLLVLNDIATALQCPVAQLLGDMSTTSPEWLLLRDLLKDCDEAALRRAREAASATLGHATATANSRRIALIGLRGAGKTTLGARLAFDLGYPFVELSHAVEALAGCGVAEIQALYGLSAYRRYERRALEQTLAQYSEVVIAAPGGLVSDTGSFELLLSQCATVWLQADPQDHMGRVLAQGDTRPMDANPEAMDDLRAILAGRTPFYAKANHTIHTSGKSIEAASVELNAWGVAHLKTAQ